MKRFLIAGAAAFALFGAASAANASIVFTFDSILDDNPYTTASETVSGLTASISTVVGSFMTTTGASGIPGMSGNSLLNFNGGGADFVVNFSSLVTNVSIVGGDHGFDTDNLFLSAYTGLNGTGSLVGTFIAPPCCDAGEGSVVLSVLGSGIMSVKFNSLATDGFPGSVYFDNLTVGGAGRGGVPEPATWALMLTGFFGAGAALRRRRGAVAAA